MDAPKEIYIDTDLIAFHVLNERHDGDIKYIRSDLAELAWEDIERIDEILTEVASIYYGETEGFYTEVLHRFQTYKEGKK